MINGLHRLVLFCQDPDSPSATPDGPVTRPWGEREFELLDPDGHRWAFTGGPSL